LTVFPVFLATMGERASQVDLLRASQQLNPALFPVQLAATNIGSSFFDEW